MNWNPPSGKEMSQKAKGGRGQKAVAPYQRLSVTVPPRLKTWLDEEAQRQGVTRSDVVVQALAQAKRAGAATAATQPSAGPILKQRGKGKRR